MFYIYYIVNTITKKAYIGATSRPAPERLREHFYKASCGKPSLLYDAMRTHDLSTWKVDVLVQVDHRGAARLLERAFVAIFHANKAEYGYNETKGGNGFVGRRTPRHKPPASREEMECRLLARRSIDRVTDCWNFVGGKQKGYGQIGTN